MQQVLNWMTYRESAVLDPVFYEKAVLHVVVELDKFRKTLDQIETDLDKLLYTMKLTPWS